MEEPNPFLARAETSADDLIPMGSSESTAQEPLLHVIAEDGRPIELLIERSSEEPDVEGEEAIES